MNTSNDVLLNFLATDPTHTAREISHQPALWEDTYKLVLTEKTALSAFLNRVFENKNRQIILTGAGTSAFIGEILSTPFNRNTGIGTNIIPTTDIVTHPEDFFRKSTPILLVSFARSGDSPESLATFELAGKLCNDVYHLIITCNLGGELARAAQKQNAYTFLMPPAAYDLALAMTGAFTSMLLSGLLISDIQHIENYQGTVKRLSEFGRTVLDKYEERLRAIANLEFKRVVFLGSGVLKGAAKESHLKMQELTDGKIICKYDSFLGFRHGPKAVIDESTLLVYLFSNDPYVHQYEIDLVNAINEKEDFLFSIGIGQNLAAMENLNLGLAIDLSAGGSKISDDFFSICSVLPAQILGFYKSLLSGLTPDSPSQNGGISRVVQGVTIYPY
ncbi:MAG: SIS domain-containing protein [Ferruginibacter sp.]